MVLRAMKLRCRSISASSQSSESSPTISPAISLSSQTSPDLDPIGLAHENSSFRFPQNLRTLNAFPTKSIYRIMVLGASKTGKTSIIQQFLYDQFSSKYEQTIDDMYRGEFEMHERKIVFDIQDVSGSYVYDFPGMRNVSFTSANAFILVFSLESLESWNEIYNLREMIHKEKSTDTPIVIVGNKADLHKSLDPEIPHESVEAISVFDWEHGYVQSSAKDRSNVDKIFTQLLQQFQVRYPYQLKASESTYRKLKKKELPFTASTSQPIALPCCPQLDWIKVNSKVKTSKINDEDCLKRRQSLPRICPAHGIAKVDDQSHTLLTDSLDQSWKMKGTSHKSKSLC